MVFGDTARRNSVWMVDSGERYHICYESQLFAFMERRDTPMIVSIGDGSTLSCAYETNVNIVFGTPLDNLF